MRAREATKVHTRIMKCALELEEARAYWKHADGVAPATKERAFEELWFGAKSLARVEVLLSNFRCRFDLFPPALTVLHQWSATMSPATRRLVCHWHLQLADPVYRALTGDYLVSRRLGARPEVTRDLIVRWLPDPSGQWTMATRIQFASKLLSAAFAAGLVGSNRDPRPVTTPRVPDDALEYLLYLLRTVDFDGRLVDNLYLRSVGIDAGTLGDRLRTIDGIELRRAGDLHEFTWSYDGLASWANARIRAAA